VELNIVLAPATIAAIDAAVAADPVAKKIVSAGTPKAGTAPSAGSSIGSLLSLVLPFFGTWGTAFTALLPIISEALQALQETGMPATPTNVIAKMHAIAGCK
jgi:hypothetical protein